MELVQKVLETKGSSIMLMQKGTSKRFGATLRWTSNVDLDLYCFYKLKATGAPVKKGFLDKIFSSMSSQKGGEGTVSYKAKGSMIAEPWIQLDHDAGVGDVGGNNEENIHFADLNKLDGFIIAANIFNKNNANFSSYNGSVIVRGGGQEITVPLVERSPGAWCVVASVKCSPLGDPVMRNVNKTLRSEPKLSDFI